MKICIDGRAAQWYRGTGIGTYTYQLIKGLSSIDPINSYNILEPINSNISIAFKKNFSVSYIKAIENDDFWGSIKDNEGIRDFKMDIYHVPQNGIGLPKNLSCKKIITLHDIIPLKMPETVSERYLKLFNEDMEGILNNCAGVITVSAFSQRDIAEAFNYPLEKIYVTHLAAEDIYKPMDRAYCKDLIKRTYGLNEDFILYVGGFSPRKNILGIIEAFSKLKGRISKDIKLVIVGKKGKSYDIYKSRAIELGIEESVIFTGFIPLEHMPLFYNAALFLAYPSFYEGFGLPPLESMACGTPVVAANSTSLPEILGNNALLVNPSDIEDIYQGFLRLLEDEELRKVLTQKGLEHSFDFNWNKTALNTLSAYSSLMKQ